MAGQHRIEALRDYVKLVGADPKELWWTCNFYDRDKIPAELDVKLRVNRSDPSLPDNHGEIWMQLVLTTSHTDSLFQGKKADVEKEMLNILQLNSEVRFPISRLVTLWKNNRWRSMITSWCRTEVGRSTFNISTFDWMASYRIDSYWFSTFEQVLSTLESLPGNPTDSVYVTDWAKMVAALPNGYSGADVKELFYPRQSGELELSAPVDGKSLTRHKGFLEEMNNDEYDGVYRHISQHRDMVFSDVQKMLKTTKEEGRIMMQVMTHVISWLNPYPAVVMDKRENNKPLLRESLKPILQDMAVAPQQGEEINGVEATASVTEDWAVRVERESIDLEKRILNTVQQEMAKFKTPSIKASLNILPADGGNDYAKRFTEEPWKAVLNKVEEVLGPDFRSSLTFALPRPQVSQVSNLQPASSITRAICALVPNIPEVSENPALNSQQAFEELGASVEQAVIQWVAQRCRPGLESSRPSELFLKFNEGSKLTESSHIQSEPLLDTAEAPWGASPSKDRQSVADAFISLPSASTTADTKPDEQWQSSKLPPLQISGQNGQDHCEMVSCPPMPSLAAALPTATPTDGQLPGTNQRKSTNLHVPWPPFQTLFCLNED
ncbi:hypothetical protein AK830_g5533 [Neonectria ditissima]|uniref:Uncharacterized protein n=1 Tax=Neonectria ditissima TaxID=78410 RepID=A0A0P7B4M4_9HYPO|nr:hypothetical protein AK830_g5533 [Neonectria ditissima]